MDDKPVPEEITCGEQVFDIAFHPTSNVLAAGLIDGAVEVWGYGVEEGTNTRLSVSNHHRSSCRGVHFSPTGDLLYSISSDKTIRAVDGQGKQTMLYEHAHDAAINKMLLMSEHILATGDDAGEVKLWDLRVGSAVMEWHLHEDFVSGLVFHEEANVLLSVGGDATLCAYDMRQQKKHYRSDEQESELHCIQVIKNGRKVIAGTQDGVILVFSWDQWGDCSDRYPGHPETVDCMYKVDESTVITGSSDGLLRVVAIQPNKILGVIGDHEDFPVEGVRSSREGTLLGSFAHDEVVRFWDISLFQEDDGTEFDVDEDGSVKSVKEKGEKAGGKRKAAKVVAATEEKMATEEEEGEEGEDWESVDDGEDEEDEEGEEEGEEEEGEGEGEEGAEAMEEGSDYDSGSDSSEEGGKGPKMLPTASEKFFADL